MPEIFEAFQECGDVAALESLLLRFSPSLLPPQQRWRNNGLSADFLADYVTTFFPKDEADPASAERQSTVKGAVNYIANELLENAMKYSGGVNIRSPFVCCYKTIGSSSMKPTRRRRSVWRIIAVLSKSCCTMIRPTFISRGWRRWRSPTMRPGLV